MTVEEMIAFIRSMDEMNTRMTGEPAKFMVLAATGGGVASVSNLSSKEEVDMLTTHRNCYPK